MAQQNDFYVVRPFIHFFFFFFVVVSLGFVCLLICSIYLFILSDYYLFLYSLSIMISFY